MNTTRNCADSLLAVFDEAAQFDTTLVFREDLKPKLLKRYIGPESYTRDRMFGEMLAGRPCVLTGYPVPLQAPYRDLEPRQIAPAIMEWLAAQPGDERHRVFTGPTGVRRDLTLKEVAAKWKKNTTRFGVTDLHIRNTEMADVIAPDVISAFNLLCKSTTDGKAQEMFSYVISSYGHVTDSHSDDPDSTNYCFTGKKLWLAWDTYEGAKRGLQDVERVPVSKKAKFNFEAWLSLPSARWFVVEPGQILFLPAHLTHKVVTLGRYIGVGGFFIAVPNCLRLMAHWAYRGPLWTKRDALGERDFILSEVAQTVREEIVRLRGASLQERRTAGLDYLDRSAQYFIRTCPKEQLRALWDDPRFRCVADVVDAPWPLSAERIAA